MTDRRSHAYGVLVGAAVLGIIDQIYGVLLPSLIRWLDDGAGGLSTTFTVISLAALALDLGRDVLVAFGAALLVRHRRTTAARVASVLAGTAAIVLAIRLLLPMLLPGRYAVGSGIDRTVRLVTAAPYLLQGAAMVGLALALRAVAGPGRERVAATAGTLAAVVAIGMPAMAWAWFVEPLGAAWGLSINHMAVTVLFAGVVVALRRELQAVVA